MDAVPESLWAHVKTPEDVGVFLVECRRDAGLTQAQLADRLGITRRAVYEIESGKSTQHVDRIFAMLGLLGISLSLHASGLGEGRAAALGVHEQAGVNGDQDLNW